MRAGSIIIVRMSDSTSSNAGPVLAVLRRGPATTSVLRTLEDEGVAVELREMESGSRAWRDSRSFPAVIVDDSIRPEDLKEARDLGWIRSSQPAYVVAERLPSRQRYIDWLAAGAWDVVKIPLESAALALQLRNILRAQPDSSDSQERRYSLETLEQVAAETLSLAMRHDRPFQCVAVTLDWKDPDAGPDGMLDKLAREAEDLVRSSDLIGLGDRSTIIVLLPETDQEGADTFMGRLEEVLEARLREWGVLAGLTTARVSREEVDSGRELLSLVVRRLGTTRP